jgi:predicted DNA-binding protein with PD1-like motif
VIAGEAPHTRCVMGRLERGEPVLDALRELARLEKVDAGFVRAQGAVEDAVLSLYDPVTRAYAPAATLPGPSELLSLEGSVSLAAGGVDVRLWAVLARAGAAGAPPVATGGLLAAARALYVEFAIDVYDDGDLERRPDAASGLALWRAPRRR